FKVQCNQDQFYLLIATAVGGSIFLVKTGSVLSINQQEKGSMKPLIYKINDIMKPFFRKAIVYSTVTLLARFRGLSTSM
ncbi:hypothetical protein DXA08_12355, partial [Blautia obeum]